MREIYFRGKRADNGEWVYSGTLIHFDANTENEACFMPMRGDTSLCVHDENYNINQVLYAMYYNVVPETVGQYTGLTDKNGKKIFEGDILKGYVYPFFNEEKGEFNYFAEVVWFENSPAFGYTIHKNPLSKVKGISDGDTDYLEDFYSNCWEVIGNIHDNPELLGGDAND